MRIWPMRVLSDACCIGWLGDTRSFRRHAEEWTAGL
jgi:hypothetical protein